MQYRYSRTGILEKRPTPTDQWVDCHDIVSSPLLAITVLRDAGFRLQRNATGNRCVEPVPDWQATSPKSESMAPIMKNIAFLTTMVDFVNRNPGLLNPV